MICPPSHASKMKDCLGVLLVHKVYLTGGILSSCVKQQHFFVSLLLLLLQRTCPVREKPALRPDSKQVTQNPRYTGCLPNLFFK